MKKETKDKLEWIFLWIALICSLLFVVAGCKTKTLYVPVDTVKTEYINKVQRDSIHLLDSVFVDRWRSNDTVYLTTEKYKYLYRDKFVTDTIIKIDSVQVPYPVIEEVKIKEPYTWYEKLLMALGLIGIGAIGYTVFRFVRK